MRIDRLDHTVPWKPVDYLDPELLAEAARIVADQWGDYGYRIGVHTVAAWTGKAAMFQVTCVTDGAEFILGKTADGTWFQADVKVA